MKQIKKANLTSVLVLLVFALFAVCIMQVLLTGAQVVQDLTRGDQTNYLHRTAVQYVTMRVRQADEGGMVDVRRMEDREVLVLSEEIEGSRYETLVYYEDGYLREMFCPAGSGIPLEFGEEILELEDFSAEKQDSLLTVRLQMTDGTQQNMILHLRAAEEAES